LLLLFVLKKLDY